MKQLIKMEPALDNAPENQIQHRSAAVVAAVQEQDVQHLNVDEGEFSRSETRMRSAIAEVQACAFEGMTHARVMEKELLQAKAQLCSRPISHAKMP